MNFVITSEAAKFIAEYYFKNGQSTMFSEAAKFTICVREMRGSKLC
jgi:hypothetical protein